MSKELGTLIVVVLKARNLNDKHSFYKQDVFAQVSLNGTTKRTPVDIKGGQHPVWDAEIRFPVMKETSEKNRKLEVSCWAKEPRTEDLLGQGKVDITETLRTGEFDDWVALDVEGVVRGELYLEMTYYANKPTSSTLAVPQDGGIIRRPSKLSPATRLFRPSQPQTPPKSASSSPSPRPERGRTTQPSSSPNHTHLRLPSPSSSSSSGRQSPLSRLPEDTVSRNSIPDVLAPGGGLRPKPQPQSQSPQQVPSLLRPGNPSSSPIPVIHPVSSGTISYPSNTPPPEYIVPAHSSVHPPIAGSSIPSYSAGASRPATNIGYSPTPVPVYHGPPSSGPETWRTNASPLSFPVAMVSPTYDDYNYPFSNLPHPTSSSYRPAQNNDLSDPYLQARYQTPLPLPPGSTKPSRGDGTASKRISGDESARIHALRRAEEEAARRREQEERDLELARQLDRELNLEEDLQSETHPTDNHRTNNTRMPGSW